jgi:hypothetical protein
LEDVLVKVDQFILPVDFIALDMEESPMPLPLPIVLGSPFMRTGDTKIFVQKGIVKMKMNGEKIEFKVFDTLQLSQDNLDCSSVCVLQNVVEKDFKYIRGDRALHPRLVVLRPHPALRLPYP